ncbi:MAG: Mrp/NBP35 family ATP-binding protein [Nitrososphaerales archaeon]
MGRKNIGRIDKSAIIDVLKKVIDPEIGMSIVDLNMVRRVEIDGDKVKVKIALTVPNCPLANTIKSDVEKAIMGIEGMKAADVELTSMTKEEFDALAASLRQKEARRTAPSMDRLEKKGIRNIIAIVSGKGGVGKSFVTGMLAVELKRQGHHVGILDADITGASIAKIFGLGERLTKGELGINPVSTKSGIKVVSMNLALEDPTTPIVWRGPLINSAIKQLYQDVDWGDLHYLLIDLPPGTSDAPLTVFQSLPIDGAIVVSSPQDLATMVVKKAINMAKRMNIPILGLIENMSYIECPKCKEKIELYGSSRGFEFAENVETRFLGKIPVDSNISILSDQGRLEDYTNPAFKEITRAIRSSLEELVKQTSARQPIAWSQ